MNPMKLLVVWIVSMAALSMPAFANSHIEANANAELEVQAGISPGNALYTLDRAMERIRERLTFSHDAKAQFYVAVAEERLAEAEVAASADTQEHVDVLMQEYQKAMEKARTEAQLSQQIEVKTNVAARLEKHVDVLEGLQAELQENGTTTIGISNALENSQKSLVRLRATLVNLNAEADTETETSTETSSDDTSANVESNTSANTNGANVRVGVGANIN